MSAPQPPGLPPPSPSSGERYRTLTHNLSLGLLFLCPAIALLPPRKLDLYTFSLGGAWIASANHLTRERSGRSILEHFNGVGNSIVGHEMPTEKARELQKRVREERQRTLRESANGGEEVPAKQRGILEKVWMGDEKEGWKERRLQEEREAIEEGRGYGGLIVDQIWEVWNWGKAKEGDDNMTGKAGEEDANRKPKDA